MAEISIIGLGVMGSSLAHCLHQAEHKVTVWNRSPEKMHRLVRDGLGGAASVHDAINSSPLLIICIDNYASSQALFDPEEVRSALRGRTVVQLTSGTPKEAHTMSAWMLANGTHYLDGAILAAPPNIGTSAATFLLAGRKEAYDNASMVMECLAPGNIRYVGLNVKVASALDLAWLMSCYGTFLAGAHAAQICRSEGVELAEFDALIPDNQLLQRYIRVIADGSFDEFSASLQVWRDALAKIQSQGLDTGENTEIPDFIANLLDRAIDAGHAQQNVMAFTKTLKPPR